MRLPSDNRRRWSEAIEYCEHYSSELLAWRSEAEWKTTEIFIRELAVAGLGREQPEGHPWAQFASHDSQFGAWAGAYHQYDQWGDWTWSDQDDDFVPMAYGWMPNQPDLDPDLCSILLEQGANSDVIVGLDNERCDIDKPFICSSKADAPAP